MAELTKEEAQENINRMMGLVDEEDKSLFTNSMKALYGTPEKKKSDDDDNDDVDGKKKKKVELDENDAEFIKKKREEAEKLEKELKVKETRTKALKEKQEKLNEIFKDTFFEYVENKKIDVEEAKMLLAFIHTGRGDKLAKYISQMSLENEDAIIEEFNNIFTTFRNLIKGENSDNLIKEIKDSKDKEAAKKFNIALKLFKNNYAPKSLSGGKDKDNTKNNKDNKKGGDGNKNLETKSFYEDNSIY